MRVPGLSIHLKVSKTDQERKGDDVGISHWKDPSVCPVRALQEWLRASGIRSGRVFPISPQMVGRIVTTRVAATSRAGEVGQYSGHSLRVGFVTESYRRGTPEAQIMGTTRHRSVNMLAVYRREADPVARGGSALVDISDIPAHQPDGL